MKGLPVEINLLLFVHCFVENDFADDLLPISDQLWIFEADLVELRQLFYPHIEYLGVKHKVFHFVLILATLSEIQPHLSYYHSFHFIDERRSCPDRNIWDSLFKVDGLCNVILDLHFKHGTETINFGLNV